MPRFIFKLFALLFGLLLCTANNIRAQAGSDISAFCDSLFQFGLNEKQMLGGAVAVVENNRVLFTKSYGFADWEKQSLARPDTTLFQIGSVGKLLTVIAVLQQVDQGKLELDNHVRVYLGDFPLDQKFNSPITLRNLLTHSAGFDDRVIGYAVRTKSELQFLETHLRARMPRRFQDAGVSINYSNYSYGLAGLIVEKVSGQPFTEYVRRHIFAPLEMNAATYHLPTSANENPAYATGYAKRDESFVAQPLFYTQVKPAGGLSASASDMAQLLLMLLNDGAYLGREILRSESLGLMLARQFSNHEQMRGYTLGFEEQNFGGEFAVAKGGQTLGFVSVLLLFPHRKLGVFVTSNTSSDDFVENFVRAFVHKYIAGQALSVAMANGSIAIELERFSGVYRNSRHNHHSVEDLIALFRDNARVWSVRNDTLVLSVNGVARKYRPVATHTFQNLNDTGDYLVFRENAAGKIDGFYCSLSFAGLGVPATYEKVAWYSTPVTVNEFFLSFLPVYLMSYILLPLLLGCIFLIRLFKKDFLKSSAAAGLPRWAHGLGMSFAVLSTLYGFGYIAKLNHAGTALVFGVPESLHVLNFIPFILILLLVGLIYFAVKIWRERKTHLIARFYFSGFVIAGMLFVGFLYQWHFVGFRY